MPPSRHLHAAPSPPPCRPSGAQRRAHTVLTRVDGATTLQQRRRNVTLTPLHAALTPPSRPAARSSHAALTPAERLLHAARTQLAHCHNAAAKAVLTQRLVALTQLHAAQHAAITQTI